MFNKCRMASMTSSPSTWSGWAPFLSTRLTFAGAAPAVRHKLPCRWRWLDAKMAISSGENAVDWEAVVHQHVKHPNSVRRGKESLWSLHHGMATPAFHSLMRTSCVLCLTKHLLRAIHYILKLGSPPM